MTDRLRLNLDRSFNQKYSLENVQGIKQLFVFL
jgi:hypothetical protein